MRFQKLTIHNIASIEDAEIDFERQPLADSEVFLITGKTGSGKSTLLDAICLALFNDTPRMKGTQMEGRMKDGSNEVQIDDARQLMRRNTAEASVRLTFVGSNGVHYEAVWAVARARKKVTGNLQRKSWELKNLDSGHTLSRDNEIRQEISAAIGLDFEQFCRTTMLAQGEFTRFLNSKDSEKAAILEKITGVAIYSKIGAKLYEVTQTKRQTWEEAQRKADSVKTFTDEELAEKQAELKSLDASYHAHKCVAEQEKGKLRWMQEDKEKEEKVAQAAETFRQAQSVMESEDFKRRETLVRLWRETTDARAWLREKNRCQKNIAEQDKAMERLSEELVAVKGGMEFARQEHQETEKELENLQAYFAQEASRVKVYEGELAIRSDLTSMKETRKAIEEDGELHSRQRKQLVETLTPAMEKAMRTETEARSLLSEKEAEVKCAEADLAALNLPEIRKEQETLAVRLAHISTAREHCDALAKAEKAHGDKKKELDAERERIKGKEKDLEVLRLNAKEAKGRMEAARDICEKQKDTVDKFARNIRQRLRLGEVCPVCGQVVRNELPHEDALLKLMEEMDADYQRERESYEKVDKNQRKLEAQIAAETRSYKKERLKWEQDCSVEEAEQRLQKDCQALSLTCNRAEIVAQLGALEARTQARMDVLAKRITDGEVQEKEVSLLRRAMDGRRKVLDACARDSQMRKSEVEMCEREIGKAQARIGSNQRMEASAEARIAHLVGSQLWGISWKDAPDDFLQRLSAASQAYRMNVQQRQELEKKLQRVGEECKNVGLVLDNMLAVSPQWGGLPIGNVRKVPSLLERANALSSRVTAALTNRKTAADSLAENNRLLTEFFAGHESFTIDGLISLDSHAPAAIEDLAKRLEQVRQRVVAQEKLLDVSQKEYAEHQRTKPLLTEEDSAEAVQNRVVEAEKRMGELKEKTGSIRQQLWQDEQNRRLLGDIRLDAQKKQQEYQRWNRVNQLIGDANGKRFQKIAQSYVLANLVHSANYYMKSLTNRYTLRVVPGTFVISLEDAYQGYVSRAASTISGGESFLVSLSLALALSDIGRRLSVDTLFIDEGFGTLSGEPLQKAIDTLRSLHTHSGRQVGIISHVEELKERIPVQIQVVQEGHNSNSTVSVVTV